MAKNKTRPNDVDVQAFLTGIENKSRRDDAQRMLNLMREVTGDSGRMWGASIIGFGVHRYPLAGGKIGEICKIGYAPRASALALYLGDFPEREDCLARLGKHRTGASCIYIPRIDAVDNDVLIDLLRAAWGRPDED